MRPKIAISSCLLGENVRFNGGHCAHKWLINELGAHVDWLPLCPEVAMGLGVPREALRLVGNRKTSEVELQTSRSRLDKTVVARTTIDKLIAGQPYDLCGWVLKKGSPTCGVDRVKIYNDDGVPQSTGEGMLVQRLEKKSSFLAELPMIDEGRLNDQGLRERFLLGVFTLARFCNLDETKAELQKFHRQHKYLLMALSPHLTQILGQIAAHPKELWAEPVRSTAQVFGHYRSNLLQVLKKPLTQGRLINSFEHIYGYLSAQLDLKQRRFVNGLFSQYRNSEIPWLSLLTTLEFIVHSQEQTYLKEQWVFAPYPKGLERLSG